MIYKIRHHPAHLLLLLLPLLLLLLLLLLSEPTNLKSRNDCTYWPSLWFGTEPFPTDVMFAAESINTTGTAAQPRRQGKKMCSHVCFNKNAKMCRLLSAAQMF